MLPAGWRRASTSIKSSSIKTIYSIVFARSCAATVWRPRVAANNQQKEITMKLLSNMKFGKKIALGMGTGILTLICLTVVAVWGLHAINAAVEAAQQQARMTVLAEQIASRVVGVSLHIGSTVVSGRASREDLER